MCYNAKFENKKMARKGGRKIVCYNYWKLVHIIAECSEIKNKPTTSKKPYKKKALKATSDKKSESEEEMDKTNMYFMAIDNTPKVTPKITLDDCELSMNELGEAFEELFKNYDFLKRSI